MDWLHILSPLITCLQSRCINKIIIGSISKCIINYQMVIAIKCYVGLVNFIISIGISGEMISLGRRPITNRSVCPLSAVKRNLLVHEDVRYGSVSTIDVHLGQVCLLINKRLDIVCDKVVKRDSPVVSDLSNFGLCTACKYYYAGQCCKKYFFHNNLNLVS